MDDFKLLLVEDGETELSTCAASITRYKDEKNRDIVLVECRSLKDALQQLDNSFDGAIIDLKLEGQDDGGNQVVNKMIESNLRIPIAILTGTPDNAPREFAHIGVFTKGEADAEYVKLFDKFWDVHKTGLTRIMGGRGVIEKTLSEVFLKNLLPQKEKWVIYGKADSERTEKALLRHTLCHLLQLLDEDDSSCFPEEVYFYPPLSTGIRTGSIVEENANSDYWVILNPACDLVVRSDGDYKTDQILLAKVLSQEEVFPNHSATNLNRTQKKELEKAYKNTKSLYYHWLPRTNFFTGGFVNFRKIEAVNKAVFDERFKSPKIQVSSSFIKDIVARFSSYYARQGQPEIEVNFL